MAREEQRNGRSLWVRYSEWIFRTLLLVGVMANLWLTRNFVTRGEFESSSSLNINDHLGIKSSIVDLGSTMKIMAANQSRLDDHENRVRTLESRQIDVISRLTAAERHLDRIDRTGK